MLGTLRKKSRITQLYEYKIIKRINYIIFIYIYLVKRVENFKLMRTV